MTDRTHPDSGRITGGIVEMLQARIADLEAQLEAIGAGGVTGPLIGQPQAMPDLSELTERGAKAWAGVDAQGLREGFTAADMATASAQGFRDGVASIAANAGEPTPAHIKAMERAWLWMENQADGQSKGGHETFDLMMLREERDALRAAIDVAAPPAAQAKGWRLVPVEPTPAMGKAAADAWLDCGSRLVLNKAAAAVAAGIAAAPSPPTSAEGVEHG